MPTWNELFENVARKQAASLRATADRAGFEQWCELVEDSVLETLGSIALSRSAELAARSTVRVDVRRLTTRRYSGAGAHNRILSLVLGGSRVDLYSTREVGQVPALHYALMRTSASPHRGSRFPVITSLPGCTLVRRADDGVTLLSAAPQSPGAPRPVVTYDAMILHAFELLLGAAEATRALSH
jgi:hypothetical protein